MILTWLIIAAAAVIVVALVVQNGVARAALAFALAFLSVVAVLTVVITSASCGVPVWDLNYSSNQACP